MNIFAEVTIDETGIIKQIDAVKEAADRFVKFRAVPEITHRKWKELNLMSPLRPDETPDFKFQELQMKLYYTIYI